jgi:hypothetical protein
LSLVIHAIRLTHKVARQHSKVSHLAVLPQEGMPGIASGYTTRTNHLTAIIDRICPIAYLASQISKINCCAVPPEHSVHNSSFECGTKRGGANRLSMVVDFSGYSDGIANQRREFPDLALSGTPNDGFEVKDLGRCANRILNRVFRKPGDLTTVVDSPECEAIIPSERRERSHHAVSPREPKTN